MKTNHASPNLLSVLRGMLHMRLGEMATAGTAFRLGGTFVLLFILLSFALRSQASSEFWHLVVGVFALKFLPVYCLTKGGETLRGELKDGTIEYLWTRPAAKSQLYLGFYLSSLLGIGSIAVACLLAITAAGLYLGAIASIGQILLLWFGAGLAVVCFTAIAGALGALSSKFVVIGIFYFAFVELGLSQIPTSIRSVAASSHISKALSPLTNGLSTSVGPAFAGVAVITAVALALGIALFSGMRYGVGGEKEA